MQYCDVSRSHIRCNRVYGILCSLAIESIERNIPSDQGALSYWLTLNISFWLLESEATAAFYLSSRPPHLAIFHPTSLENDHYVSAGKVYILG